MYKTIWYIININTKDETKLTYYHFGKEPRFPSWYFEEKNAYTVKMVNNLKLINNLKIFFKCLVHYYIIK